MNRPFLQFGLPLILVVALLGWYLRGRDNAVPQQPLEIVKPSEQINNPNAIIPLIEWCATLFRPVVQTAFTASNSLNQQKVWETNQFVGTLAATIECLTFYVLLQGEWRVEKIYEKDGTVKDFKAMIDELIPAIGKEEMEVEAKANNDLYPQIGFVWNEYHSGIGAGKVDYNKETGYGGTMNIRKVGLCTYHVDIRFFSIGNYNGHIMLCVFVFHGDTFHMSAIPFPIRSSHADPTKKDGTEIWYHTKIK